MFMHGDKQHGNPLKAVMELIHKNNEVLDIFTRCAVL